MESLVWRCLRILLWLEQVVVPRTGQIVSRAIALAYRLLPPVLFAVLLAIELGLQIAASIVGPRAMTVLIAAWLACTVFVNSDKLADWTIRTRLVVASVAGFVFFFGLHTAIERRLWASGGFGEPQGNRCAAFVQMTDENSEVHAALEFRSLHVAVGPPVVAIVKFNESVDPSQFVWIFAKPHATQFNSKDQYKPDLGGPRAVSPDRLWCSALDLGVSKLLSIYAVRIRGNGERVTITGGWFGTASEQWAKQTESGSPLGKAIPLCD